MENLCNTVELNHTFVGFKMNFIPSRELDFEMGQSDMTYCKDLAAGKSGLGNFQCRES